MNDNLTENVILTTHEAYLIKAIPIVTVEFARWLTVNGFFTAPASAKYHSAYEGGLFQHSQTVTDILIDFTKDCRLEWQRKESPLIIGMFHDLCKIDSYRHPILADTIDGSPIYDTSSWEYNNDTLLKGHGDKSVMLLSQFMTLTEEEIMCIRYHMGAFVDKSEWSDYTRVAHCFPNILWTHHADMIASHVDEI